jgi:hypothetical protein
MLALASVTLADALSLTSWNLRWRQLDKDVVCIAALVIQADRGLAALASAGEVVAGGLAALSALKISGLSYWKSASSRASTQNSAPTVLDSRHARSAGRAQSMIATDRASPWPLGCG